jgi:hypothetical protein
VFVDPAHGTGGDDGPAAARVLAGAAVVAEGAGSTANKAGGGATSGQRKVTSFSWGSGRVHAGLEVGGGNSVCPVAYLEPEEVAAPGQHAVGAVVERRQRRHVAVTANQDRLGTQEVGRQILRGLMGPCHVVPGRNDFGSTHSLSKFFEKIRIINICLLYHPKIDQAKQWVCRKQPEPERCCPPRMGWHAVSAEPREGVLSTWGRPGGHAECL